MKLRQRLRTTIKYDEASQELKQVVIPLYTSPARHAPDSHVCAQVPPLPNCESGREGGWMSGAAWAVPGVCGSAGDASAEYILVDNHPYSNTGNGSKPIEVVESKQFSKVDYLTLTVSVDYVESFVRAVIGLYEPETDINIQVRNGGFLGYHHSYAINYWVDNDYQQLGILAYNEYSESNRMGAVLSLSGVGCTHTDLNDLYYIATKFYARITRIDHALDLDYEFCLDRGYTVPKFGKMGYEGFFASKHATRKQEMKTAGDWSDILYGKIDIDSYNPAIHSPGGLTQYLGARTSENMIRIYEKSKEQLGKTPLSVKESERYYDLDLLWAVRIERQSTRGGNKRDISLEAIINPDAYFIQSFNGLEFIYREYVQYLGEVANEAAKRHESGAVLKSLSIIRKIQWLKHTYGRTINTMLNMGLDFGELIALIIRDRGIKAFIDDSGECISEELLGVPFSARPLPEVSKFIVDGEWVEISGNLLKSRLAENLAGIAGFEQSAFIKKYVLPMVRRQKWGIM